MGKMWNPCGIHVDIGMGFQWIIEIHSSGKPVGNVVESLWDPCGNDDGIPLDLDPSFHRITNGEVVDCSLYLRVFPNMAEAIPAAGQELLRPCLITLSGTSMNPSPQPSLNAMRRLWS